MVLDTKMNGYHALFQFYRKTFLQSVDPKQQKLSNFHFDLSLKRSQGEVHNFSGEEQNDLRGGVHLHKPPLKIRHGNNILERGPYLEMSKVACYKMKERLTYFSSKD